MDRMIAKFAERQHGVFTLDQAVSAGATPDAIRQRLGSGRWQVLADGVYRLCGAPATWEQRLLAATLAAGPSAAASHRSAAALLAIPGFDRRGTPEVTTPRARRHRAQAATVHRRRPFPAHHLTVIDGIPVTRAARTLVDLAAVLHPRRTERAVDSCLAAGTVSLAALHATFGELAGRGCKGVAVMRAILVDRPDGYVAPASELEARFLDVVRSAGMPDPARQLDAGGGASWIGRVDFAYREVGLLIELDGRRHHSALLDRESDRSRDDRLLTSGWRTVERFSWADVVDRPGLVARRLHQLLGAAARAEPVTLSGP